MRFDSLQFVAFAFFAVVLLRSANPGRIRSLLIALLNGFFLYSFAGDLVSLLPILVFSAIGYLAVLLTEKTGSRVGIGFSVTCLVAIFIWLKHYSVTLFLPQLDSPYVVVGLSYILFRVIHLVVDAGQGATKAPSPLAYTNYIFFFLSYVSGPIQRYQDFASQTSKPAPCKTPAELSLALNRIVNGFIMVIAVCALTASLSQKLEKYWLISNATGSGFTTLIFFSAAAFTHVVHLYFNFSGYMHICVGIGKLLGYSLPENFDAPYKAKNMLDFWTRWHITLSEWFKFYIFNPFLRFLQSRWGSTINARTQYLGALAFFVTFLTMGMWHGSTNIFFIYGLLLGSGVTANKIWQIEMAKLLGKERYKAVRHSVWYERASRSLTLSYFAVAVTCIWIEPGQVNMIGSGKLLLSGLLTLLMLGFLLLLVFSLIDLFKPVSRLIQNGFRLGGNWSSTMAIGFKLLILVNLIAMIGDDAPEFIYQRF